MINGRVSAPRELYSRWRGRRWGRWRYWGRWGLGRCRGINFTGCVRVNLIPLIGHGVRFGIWRNLNNYIAGDNVDSRLGINTVAFFGPIRLYAGGVQ